MIATSAKIFLIVKLLPMNLQIKNFLLNIINFTKKTEYQRDIDKIYKR